MGLRKHISNTITCKEVETEYQGDRFLFRALSDAGTYAKAFLLDARTVGATKAHYERLIRDQYGEEDAKAIEVSDELVRSIQLVYTTLVAAEFDEKTKTWVNLEHPYDISEILQIAVEQGVLFQTALVAGGLAAMGYTEEVLKG